MYMYMYYLMTNYVMWKLTGDVDAFEIYDCAHEKVLPCGVMAEGEVMEQVAVERNWDQVVCWYSAW